MRGVRGVVAGPPPMSTTVHSEPNKLWRSNFIFNLYWEPHKGQDPTFHYDADPDPDHVSRVSDPYSFFTDPDPEDPYGGQYGSGYGSGSNPDPGL